MHAEAATWHYFVAAALFAIFGAIGHVVRALFNVYPDRLSDKPIIDLTISDGYDLSDMLFGTEYDDAGYYRSDSLKNLRIACSIAVIAGIGTMLLVEDASMLMATAIDDGAKALWELLLYRLQELQLL